MTTGKLRVDAAMSLKASIDRDVYHDILKTHAKEALTFIPFGNMCLSPVTPKTIASIAALESTFPSDGHNKKITLSCASSTRVLNSSMSSKLR